MKTIDVNNIKTISGGHRNSGALYQNVIKPILQGAGVAFVGGAGPAALLAVPAVNIALHGAEQVVRKIPQFLNDAHQLNAAQVQDRLNNPYHYPD